MSPSPLAIGDLQEQARSRSPGQVRESFEARVRSARNGALLVAGLHLLSRFFGICALTWATVVLLGGFPSSLRTLDFVLVSVLLLLGGARLFIVQIFSKILSKTLFRESHRPEDFVFKDAQYDKANRLDILGRTVSSILASASLFATIVRFSLTGSHGLSGDPSGDDSATNSNLAYALHIFYWLVVVSSLLSISSALLRSCLRRKCDGQPSNNSPIKQNCLMSFHDEVYKTMIEVGFPEADQLDILEFAYTKLSRDYRRNIRPPLIKGQNKDLICYLYHNQQGIAMTCEYLNSADVWKQLVAANLPGFWAGEERIESQAALFWALQKRLYGAGKDAESALNSIECLGQAWADLPKSKQYPFLINDPASATNIVKSKQYPFLINDPASATNIVNTLVHLLMDTVRPTLLFPLRAFEACCRNPQVLQHMYGGCSRQEAQGLSQQLQSMIAGGQHEIVESVLPELCCKLFKYVSEKGVWMTTKIYAGNALLSLLCYGTGELGEDAMKSLQGPVEEFIHPEKARGDEGKRPYFWYNDMHLVEKMRKKLQLERYKHWAGVQLRGPDGELIPSDIAEASLEDL